MRVTKIAVEHVVGRDEVNFFKVTLLISTLNSLIFSVSSRNSFISVLKTSSVDHFIP